MSFTITVSSAFTAKHWHERTLNEPPHEHDFKYSVTLTGPVNEEGYLLDFRLVEAALQGINERFHGHMLNDILPLPTTENIAFFIFAKLQKTFPQVRSVTVYEKENYSSTYTAD